MNKKIDTLLAIAIMILVAGTIGALIWHNNTQITPIQTQSQSSAKKETKATVPQKNFCEITANTKNGDKPNLPSVEIERSKNSSNGSIFINHRDEYQIEYPTDKLTILGDADFGSYQTNARHWSAEIGYAGKLGAFGEIKIFCGDVESAISAYYKDNTELKIVSRQDSMIGGKKAITINSQQNGTGAPASKEVLIQYKNDRVLIIGGPAEPKSDLDIFDKMISTLIFTSNQENNRE